MSIIPSGGLKLAASRTLWSGIGLAKKYSPEILTSVGVVGIVTAGVLAARATLKLEPIVSRLEDDLAQIDERKSEVDASETRKDLIHVYARTVLDITKLYGGPVTLGAGSIVCIVSANGILRRRNVALVAAYNVLEKTFASYRERVVEEYGEDKDRDFRLGIREVEEIDEKGKKHKVATFDPNASSIYARWFDEVNATEWNRNPDYNLVTLKCQQEYANQRLQQQGYLFLNDVYDALGIERSQQGQVVGWVLSEDGDNYIDFGIYDVTREGSRRFVNGSAPGILLDFNVDGVILDKLPTLSTLARL